MRYPWQLGLLVAGLACEHSRASGASDRRGDRAQTAARPTQRCATPRRGVIVKQDSVAGFSTRATLGTLRRQCRAGDSTLYDAVGWQAVAWVFPFAGARVTAIQSKHGPGEVLHDDEAPDLWVVEGDSVRLPDGELTPPTLGALRARYGFTTVDENLPGDDIDGIHARSCRFPYLLFMLSVGDTSRRVPDSARVTRVDMDTHRVDYSIRQFCIAHQPPN